MKSAAILRVQIESALSKRIPSALTPSPRIIRPTSPTGIKAVDELLNGGLPLGAIIEVVGSACSGRTALALSFIAGTTQEGKVCAWIDVSNALHPESAAAVGVCLSRVLWVRCGLDPQSSVRSERHSASVPDEYFTPPPIKKGLHGGSFGPHPRTEVKGLSEAVSGLLESNPYSPRCAEAQRGVRPQHQTVEPTIPERPQKVRWPSSKPFSRIEQALRVTDLLLQAGGFKAIVLDLGCIAPEHATRVPAATWFRYRTAAERTQASILLLTQHACAQSSADLVLRMKAEGPCDDERTVFVGIRHQVEIVRQRFSAPPTNVIPLRKPPQSDKQAEWESRTVWAGSR